MEFTLNQTSRRSIEKQTGLTWAQIVMMESEDLDRAIALADELKDEGFKVYDNKGNLIYTP